MENNKGIIRVTLCALMLVLSACGGGGADVSGGGNSGGSSTSYTATLGSQNAPTVGAICTLADASGNTLLTGTTGADGTIAVDGLSYNGLVVLTCVGGSYVDEATGQTVDPAPTSRAAFNYSGGANVTLIASPLSEIAYRRASAVGDIANIATYNNQVANQFGLDGIALVNTIPEDLNAAAANNTEAGRLGVVLAILSQIGTGYVSADDMITDLVNEMAGNGIEPSLIRTHCQALQQSGQGASGNLVASNEAFTVIDNNLNDNPGSNDTAPQMTSANTASVEEGSTTVLSLTADDVDVTGETIIYALGGADEALFQISGSDLSLKSAPDFENPVCSGGNSCAITVTPSDGANTGSAQAITVTITDTNDNNPVVSAATVNLNENSANGTPVHSVQASDGDAGTSFSGWQITAGNTGNAFAINGSGEITVADANQLDYESNNKSYSLTVQVSDGSNTGSGIITVNLNDLNDTAPQMTSVNNVGVAENSTAVLSLTASDVDTTGETVIYALGGTHAALFQISGSNLSLQNAPDFESPICSDNSCAITVNPSDGTNIGNAQSITVTITNLNDTAPQMTSANSANVEENSTAVLTLAASDADTTGETITYILGGTDAALFQISGNSLSLQSAPDFEAPICGDNSCAITVTPSDGANTGSAQAITVTITDTNDNNPMVSAATVNLNENSANGTAVHSVQASDADADTTFSDWQIIAGNIGNAFAINSSGQITVADASQLDYESNNKSYSLTVQVSDGSNTGSGIITVSLVDLNDTAPVMTSTNSPNVAENSTAVLTLAASDADTTGETITYTLSGTDAALFQISGSDLSLQSAPDFETPICGDNSCAITVTPSDGANTGNAQAITVSITDVNDIAPVMTSASSVNVAENTTAVLTLTASDVDTIGASITYTLGGTDAALFQISGSSLSLQSAPDFETPICGDNSCAITVTPSDGVNTGNAQAITVTITDANDNNPMVIVATVSLNENSANGTVVHSVQVSDGDAGTIFSGWQITAGNTGNAFAIDNNGQITVADVSQLDYESSNKNYSLTVQVSDGSNTGSGIIPVNLVDLNDTAPVMTSTNSPNVAENSTAVLTLAASDADTTGETIIYALGGTDAALFQISGSDLSLQSAPDFETPICGDNSCAITVTPSDGANTGDAQVITVNITNANDIAPVMTSANSANVEENSTAVLTLAASDADTTGETITYTLSGTDAGLFQISGNNLSLQNAPDFETPICVNNICAITVTPSDGANTGNPQDITVTITDTNDTAPVMTSANSADVAENSTAVLTLAASDADTTGETITYTLAGADAALFQISGDALSLQSAPDFETPICGDNSCAITVMPSDGANTGDAQAITVTITDLNDNAPQMTSANSASVEENSTAVLTLTASDADTTGETITYTLGGTDVALFQISGSDLSLRSAPDFETPICGDNSCAITVTPSDQTNTGDAQTVTVTITDLPSLTIADASHDEGDTGTSTAQLTLTLSDYTNPVIVNFASSDGTATTADNDYIESVGALLFTGGSTSATIDITVNGDTDVENDETLTITLSNPINAELGSPASATLTITNDDVAVSLNDTGITWGSGNNSDCTEETIQDCGHGRDAQAEAGTLSKVGDGEAGFDFTRLNSDGTDYSGSGNYISEPWACVRDNHTGLVWEVKTNHGLHDKDDTYNWYNTDPNTNGGAAGYENDDGTICHGYIHGQSATYCNTEAFVNRVNTAGLCGASDWRLPTIKELMNIVHRGRSNPAIDTDYFPNTVGTVDAYYWLSSPSASDSDQAWAASFYNGNIDTHSHDNAYRVHLVRGDVVR